MGKEITDDGTGVQIESDDELSDSGESESSFTLSSEDLESEDFTENDATESPYDELVIQIDGMLEKLEPCLSSKRCIYRVPEKLRKLNEQAYTPRVVSIGPFHHGSERLRSGEALKKRHFKRLVKWSKLSLRKYVELVKGLEGRARECYAETIEMGSDEFVSMMLIDACFIIDYLLKSYNTTWITEEDKHVLTTPWLRADIRLDLMLLENQIPFFVLNKIFIRAIADRSRSFAYLAHRFFRKYNIHKIGHKSFKSVNHFSDLILMLSRPRSPRLRRRHKRFEYVYSATELHEAGVRFQVGSSKCLFDVNFKKNVLEIPCFRLNDHTETFIRNLMALELCHYPSDSYIIDYIFFMDYLVNTTKDVDLLSKNGIIVNWLGDSSAAADLYNNLCVNVTLNDDNFYFSRVCEDLNAYYKVPMHKQKATFRRDYFSTPWKTASTIAAITLLVLTLMQTICSILSLTR